MEQSKTFTIQTQVDIENVRREARAFAVGAGLDRHQTEMVVLAVSELATNLQRYASEGQILFTRVSSEGRTGVQVQSHDQGPGIADLSLAMQDGYSTGGGLGSGLPAVDRLMDEFEIDSGPEGTTVTARKWTTSPTA